MGSVLSKHEKHLRHEKHVPVDPLLIEVSDVMSTSLDLDTTLRRGAGGVRKGIDYEIFANLLFDEKKQELGLLLQVGYPPEVPQRSPMKRGGGGGVHRAAL